MDPAGLKIPIGVGRRNWQSAGPDTGGGILARAITLIRTAKMKVSIRRFTWPASLPAFHDHSINRLGELLP